MVVTVARYFESLGEVATKLSGELETCLRFTVVPKSEASKLTYFEIDS